MKSFASWTDGFLWSWVSSLVRRHIERSFVLYTPLAEQKVQFEFPKHLFICYYSQHIVIASIFLFSFPTQLWGEGGVLVYDHRLDISSYFSHSYSFSLSLFPKRGFFFFFCCCSSWNLSKKKKGKKIARQGGFSYVE